MSGSARPIVVVGSLNADLVQRVARVPVPGETVSGEDLLIVPGGKGGNQAYAAGRLAAAGVVSMVGNVGCDAFATLLKDSLQAASVDTEAVVPVAGASGTACILVLPHGENLIVVSPAANGRLSPDDVRERLGRKLSGDEAGGMVLCQLEVPIETTVAALETARQHGATTMLDPAPAQALDDEMLRLVDYLTPNQSEAALLLGSRDPISSVAEAIAAAKKLLARGPNTVIVKLGEQGCVVASAGQCEHLPGFRAEVRDTTAAGDTFNGALAAALSEGTGLPDSIRFAHAAAAISVSRFGAQTSIPTRGETDTFRQARLNKNV